MLFCENVLYKYGRWLLLSESLLSPLKHSFSFPRPFAWFLIYQKPLITRPQFFPIFSFNSLPVFFPLVTSCRFLVSIYSCRTCPINFFMQCSKIIAWSMEKSAFSRLTYSHLGHSKVLPRNRDSTHTEGHSSCWFLQRCSSIVFSSSIRCFDQV